jgi:hypothetical protein
MAKQDIQKPEWLIKIAKKQNGYRYALYLLLKFGVPKSGKYYQN